MIMLAVVPARDALVGNAVGVNDGSVRSMMTAVGSVDVIDVDWLVRALVGHGYLGTMYNDFYKI